MGEPKARSPVLLITAVFSRYDAAFEWARSRCIESWGPIALESSVFDFDQTTYYERTMGRGLRKQFWAFERLISPGQLPEIKVRTNDWESQYAATAGHAEPRPLNLDPGYITLGKLVLASTKDHAHRIYLDRDIFAEVTLHYEHGAWRDHPWTFNDYRRAEYKAFFTACRNWLHKRL